MDNFVMAVMGEEAAKLFARFILDNLGIAPRKDGDPTERLIGGQRHG